MAGDRARFLAAYDAVLGRWPVPVETVDLTSVHGTTRVIACGPTAPVPSPRPPAGAGDAPPLVLLHGYGVTSAVWYANAADLSRARRVYAVDRIGEAGRSLPGAQPIRSSATLLEWLQGVLDGLGLERADFCGHSYGAWLALSYSLRAPSRVRRLILLDPTRCFAGYRPGYLLHATAMLRPSAARARAFLAWETRGAADPAWTDLFGLAAEFPRAKVVTGKRPRPRELRRAATPTLVLLAGGSRAHSIRRVRAAARRHLPHAETAVLPGLSHHAMPSGQAGALDRMILNFLDSPGH